MWYFLRLWQVAPTRARPLKSGGCYKATEDLSNGLTHIELWELRYQPWIFYQKQHTW